MVIRGIYKAYQMQRSNLFLLSKGTLVMLPVKSLDG